MMKNRCRLGALNRHLTWPGPPPRHAPRARISNNYMKWLRSEGHFLRSWVEILMFRLGFEGLMAKIDEKYEVKA